MSIKATYLILLLLTVSCSRAAFKTPVPATDESAQKAPVGPPAFNAVNATQNQCPTGGFVYYLFNDNNINGLFDDSENLINQQIICNGLQGENGTHGSNGTDGTNGTNGTNGQDGQDANIGPFTPVDLIFACGNTSPYKEVLIRLNNGQILASFSNNTQGDMTRLGLLPDGTFMNTDNTGCVFTLSTSNDGSTRSISWNNQVQMSWPLTNN